jgi:hypothetical protein
MGAFRKLRIVGCISYSNFSNSSRMFEKQGLTMEFQTKVIVSKKNFRARISDIGGILFFGSILLAVLLNKTGYEEYPFWTVGAGLILLIVGGILAKRDLSYIQMSDTDLVVSSQGIRIGDQFYPLGQMENLDFWVEGYYGMPGPRFKSWKRGQMNGMENKVHFRMDGERHLHQFYLADLISMQQLGQVFREFYEKRIPFAERNRGGPTFLFQQINSKKEMEEAKRREGYN